jgi:hypothetical protein
MTHPTLTRRLRGLLARSPGLQVLLLIVIIVAVLLLAEYTGLFPF